MCLLDFCIIKILTSTTVIIECISLLMKVTDSNDAWWTPEIMIHMQMITIHLNSTIRRLVFRYLNVVHSF